MRTGSDIQEVVGSAIAINILFGLDLWVGCLITGLDTFTFLAISAVSLQSAVVASRSPDLLVKRFRAHTIQAGMHYFEAFIATLIVFISVCFFFMWSNSGTDPVLVMEVSAGTWTACACMRTRTRHDRYSHVTAFSQGWAEPILPRYAVMQAVGTIGAVIMPHNLYLHRSDGLV